METTHTSTSRRRFSRVNYEASVRYQIGRQDGGHAVIHNVDQGGMCIRVDRALAAGAQLVVEVMSPGGDGHAIELLARVVWCEASEAGFLAGIRVYRDDYDAMVALTELVCAALKSAANVRGMRDRHFRYVEWNCAGDVKGPQRAGIWRRFVPRGSWSPSHAATLSF